MAGPTYLVLTAADAAAHNAAHPHDIVSLNQLLEVRARDQADTVCVGFVTRVDGTFGCETLTFKQLHDEVCETAYRLHRAKIGPSILARTKGGPEPRPLALLAPSCRDFLVNLFAIFRLGLSALLIAPQSTSEDIAHLCRSTGTTQLVHHESMKEPAEAAAALMGPDLTLVPMVRSAELGRTPLTETISCRSSLAPEEERETDCIIFHSSGSSGKPKPIPQKHKVWTTAACIKPQSPSFTTTPLFHGGISDLLRSMMSHSTLFFYPSTLPITASNLLAAFEALPEQATSFLSVPYILEMLGTHREGLQKLASFELVSTGGSPLPAATGDMFCKNGVRLVSRYGSSECGFLMTSMRDFELDQDWSYLRTSVSSRDWLVFEDQEDGTYELVVPATWPTRSKSNRQDGSFATSDLFRRHPTIPDAWMLCGRSDDVILLVNGEKSSPAPLEEVLRSSDLVKDVVVFGSNRPTIGAAIVPTSSNVKVEDVLPLIQQVNKIAPAHSQIPSELVVLLPIDTLLPRSSKGSLQRGRAHEALAAEINAAYDAYESGPNTLTQKRCLKGDELRRHILRTVKDTLGREVSLDADLFIEGVNSIQAARVRNHLNKTIDLGKDDKLPANIVFETGNIESLAAYVERCRDGLRATNEDQELLLMKSLAAQPDLIDFSRQAHENGTKSHVPETLDTCVLTGATGSLGAQIIPALLKSGIYKRIVCLCRAESDTHARERVLQNLQSQRITLKASEEDRLVCFTSRFEQEHLGLSVDVHRSLQVCTALVIHAAWPVHFGAGLSSFVPHLHGLRNLIHLAQGSHRGRFFFCSSTASVLGKGALHIKETLSDDPEDAVPMGYARSKHLAETICSKAWSSGVMRGRIAILRLGQLCGDTQHGIWKPEEGWPLLVSSVDCVGFLPDLKETLSWLPMDKAAHAVVDIAGAAILPDGGTEAIPVFHVVSSDRTRNFEQMLDCLQRASSRPFEIVSVSEWLKRLQEASEQGSDHPCLKMLDLWVKNYGGGTDQTSDIYFHTERAEAYTRALDTPLTPDLMERMIGYWQEIGVVRH